MSVGLDPTRIHLGRDTEGTMRAWPQIVSSVPVAPRLCMGVRPRKSPNNRAFRNPRYRGQLIGCCTGENTTAMVESLIRMPPDRTEDSPPVAAQDLSPLMTYWLARKWSRDHGVTLGPEGAIVSHAILALQKEGLVSWESWAATDPAYYAYSDDDVPTPPMMAEAGAHSVVEMALLDSFGAMLDALAVGFTLSIGMPIYQGMQATAPDGAFNLLQGQCIGGHCVELLDYDEDLDRAWVGNSWANANWGARSDDPVWQTRCAGYTNIGYCRLSDLERVFSPQAMATGQSEAVVANTVEGWAPKIRSFSEVL